MKLKMETPRQAQRQADTAVWPALGPTCWTHRPLFRIDHALLSPALAACAEVVRYARVLDDASDHYAICVDLEFPVDSTGDPDRS